MPPEPVPAEAEQRLNWELLAVYETPQLGPPCEEGHPRHIFNVYAAVWGAGVFFCDGVTRTDVPLCRVELARLLARLG